MLSIKNLVYLGALTSFLFITSCTTISTPKAPLIANKIPKPQWLAYQQNLQSLTHWQASGVIGIIADKKGESANFIWQQNKDHFWIQLYGPLGIGATSFEGNKQHVQLKRSNGDSIKANDLQTLMQSQLGWSLPLEGLYYWARGIYMPQIPYKSSLNEYGLIKTLTQQGWQIQYSHYMLYDAKYPLAEKIIFRYGANLKITLIIKSWLLNP